MTPDEARQSPQERLCSMQDPGIVTAEPWFRSVREAEEPAEHRNSLPFFLGNWMAGFRSKVDEHS